MKGQLKTAMVMAAGLGTRMRPLTDDQPKSLVEVGGKALIDWSLDHLVDAGIETAVVNVHYLAHNMKDHLARRDDINIIISDETDEILLSGGGVYNAVKHFDEAPILVVNADSFWLPRDRPLIDMLVDFFDPDRMEGALVLAATKRTAGYQGRGDFHLDEAGHVAWLAEGEVSPWFYPGIQILRSDFFRTHLGTDPAFKIQPLWTQAMAQGRLFGYASDCDWVNVETPESVDAANAWLKENAAG